MAKQSSRPTGCFVWLLAALGLLQTSAAQGATYVVDPSGSDGGTGAASDPWLTLQHAVNSVGPGDAVVVNDGTYALSRTLTFRSGGTAAAPVAFRAANPGRALITGPILRSSFGTTIKFYAGANHVRLEGLDVSGGYLYTIQAEGASYITIRDCKVHGSGREGIKVNSRASYVTIEGCEVYDLGRRDPSNSDGTDITSSSFVVVRNCHYHDGPTYGMYAKKGSHEITFENVTVQGERIADLSIGVHKTAHAQAAIGL